MMNAQDNNRRGAAAVGIIILLVVVHLIIIGMVVGGARDQDLGVRRVETVQAFYAAEAGMNMAMRELMENTDADGDGGIGSISDDGNDANDPSLGQAKVKVTTSVDVIGTTLTSVGVAGQTSRKLESVVTTGSSAGNALGLYVYRFDGLSNPSSVNDIDWDATPADTGVVTQLNFPLVGSSTGAWPGGPTSHWGQRFLGSVTVDQSGSWTFYTNSDDGSTLSIGGSLVVNNDGIHSMTTASGAINLSAGKHSVDVKWFDRTGSQGLIVYWSGPGVPVQTVIPASAWTH